MLSSGLSFLGQSPLSTALARGRNLLLPSSRSLNKAFSARCREKKQAKAEKQIARNIALKPYRDFVKFATPAEVDAQLCEFDGNNPNGAHLLREALCRPPSLFNRMTESALRDLIYEARSVELDDINLIDGSYFITWNIARLPELDGEDLRQFGGRIADFRLAVRTAIKNKYGPKRERAALSSAEKKLKVAIEAKLEQSVIDHLTETVRFARQAVEKADYASVQGLVWIELSPTDMIHEHCILHFPEGVDSTEFREWLRSLIAKCLVEHGFAHGLRKRRKLIVPRQRGLKIQQITTRPRWIACSEYAGKSSKQADRRRMYLPDMGHSWHCLRELPKAEEREYTFATTAQYVAFMALISYYTNSLPKDWRNLIRHLEREVVDRLAEIAKRVGPTEVPWEMPYHEVLHFSRDCYRWLELRTGRRQLYMVGPGVASFSPSASQVPSEVSSEILIDEYDRPTVLRVTYHVTRLFPGGKSGMIQVDGSPVLITETKRVVEAVDVRITLSILAHGEAIQMRYGSQDSDAVEQVSEGTVRPETTITWFNICRGNRSAWITCEIILVLNDIVGAIISPDDVLAVSRGPPRCQVRNMEFWAARRTIGTLLPAPP